MSRSRIVDYLPAVYQGLVPDFFNQPVEEERHATCSECAMCAPPVRDMPPEGYFSPSTKCCTYHPTLPNYAVGGLLLDTSDAGREGRRRIEDKIARRVGVTPFGIQPPPRVQFLMAHGKAGFGRATSLVCPYLDLEARACTVWAQRESECATWFCKHNHGQDGRAFWSALRNYISGTQRVLMNHALRELGFDAQVILAGTPPPTALDAAALDDLPLDDARYAARWGAWAGREHELYLTAARIVTALDRPAFERLAGLELDLLLGSLAGRHKAITNPTLPDPLIKNPAMRIDRGADGSYVLVTYSQFDPTRLQKPVFELLDLFDGRRSTAEVRSEIEATAGVRVADSFLTRLFQQRILVDPSWAIER
jgi:hypothetical protein